MPSRHFSWKQQVKVPFSNCSLLTGLLTRRENYDFFASRHGSNFLHGCPFRLSSYLSGLEILLGFGNCLAEEWSRKNFQSFPVSSCFTLKSLSWLVLLQPKNIWYSTATMESTWSQDKLPRGHNFRRNGNDSIEWPSPYKVHNLVKSLTFPLVVDHKQILSCGSRALYAFILFIK